MLVCAFCEDDEGAEATNYTLPSARWSWARFAGDVAVLAGTILGDLGSFMTDAVSVQFRFMQNRQMDMDESRDFAGEVLAGISGLPAQED